MLSLILFQRSTFAGENCQGNVTNEILRIFAGARNVRSQFINLHWRKRLILLCFDSFIVLTDNSLSFVCSFRIAKTRTAQRHILFLLSLLLFFGNNLRIDAPLQCFQLAQVHISFRRKINRTNTLESTWICLFSHNINSLLLKNERMPKRKIRSVFFENGTFLGWQGSFTFDTFARFVYFFCCGVTFDLQFTFKLKCEFDLVDWFQVDNVYFVALWQSFYHLNVSTSDIRLSFNFI